MAFVKIIIHAAWDTKNREPYLVKAIRPLIVSLIKKTGKAAQCLT